MANNAPVVAEQARGRCTHLRTHRSPVRSTTISSDKAGTAAPPHPAARRANRPNPRAAGSPASGRARRRRGCRPRSSPCCRPAPIRPCRARCPATANTASSGSENQVRVLAPFSPSASANSVTGIRQRRSCEAVAPHEAVELVGAGVVDRLGLERLAVLALQDEREAPGHRCAARRRRRPGRDSRDRPRFPRCSRRARPRRTGPRSRPAAWSSGRDCTCRSGCGAADRESIQAPSTCGTNTEQIACSESAAESLGAMWTGSKTKQQAKPSRRRLDQLALRILEQAAAEAAAGPIQRTHAHRLALAWLTYTTPPCPTRPGASGTASAMRGSMRASPARLSRSAIRSSFSPRGSAGSETARHELSLSYRLCSLLCSPPSWSFEIASSSMEVPGAPATPDNVRPPIFPGRV